MIDEFTIWCMQCLNLINTSYIVSNHGKQITFESKLSNGKVKLYPTTGTYVFVSVNGNTNSFKLEPHASLDEKEANIRKMIRYHLNPNF